MKTPHWALPDIEPPEVDFVELRTSNPVARKEHTCSYCKRTIPVGERYNSSAFLQDGEFRHEKACGGCMAGESFYADEEDAA